MAFFKNMFPKHTIAGKLFRGDKKGAVSSAVNYVKSGEILTDARNIATGNVAAIAKKGLGGSVSSLLNKKPTKSATDNNLSGGTSLASAAGSASTNVYSIGKRSADTTTTSEPNKPEDNQQMLLYAGIALSAFLLLKK
jgi:hypothetical protein